MNPVNIVEYINECTKLPFRVVTTPNSSGYTVLLSTPMGEVKIDSLRMTYGLFGAPNQVEKSIPDVIHEILDYERRSKDHLWERWLLQEIHKK